MCPRPRRSQLSAVAPGDIRIRGQGPACCAQQAPLAKAVRRSAAGPGLVGCSPAAQLAPAVRTPPAPVLHPARHALLARTLRARARWHARLAPPVVHRRRQVQQPPLPASPAPLLAPTALAAACALRARQPAPPSSPLSRAASPRRQRQPTRLSSCRARRPRAPRPFPNPARLGAWHSRLALSALPAAP